jgi:hypothetical protein
MSHRPDELSQAARALLRDYGRTMAPRHDGAAVLRAVQARLGASTSVVAPVTSRWRRLALVTGVGAIVLLGASQLLGDDAPASPGAAIADPVPELVVTEVTAATTSRGELAGPVGGSIIDRGPLGTSELRAQDVDVPPLEVSRAVPSRRAARPRPRGKEPSAASDLAAEVAVLERARTALARGDIAAADAAIAEHRREFAHGRLAAERDASAVMIACAADRDGAREAALRHSTRADAAPYRARIEATCER